MTENKRQVGGFTFIELNLVVMLVAVIGLTVYASFSAGTNIWKRLKGATPDIDAHIFLDKLSYDLRNCVAFSSIAPDGSADSIAFAVFNNSNSALPGFGTVRYSFDAASGSVSRSYSDFAKSPDKKYGNGDIMLSDKLRACSFKYYYFSNELKNGQWKDRMDNGLPSAVKVEVYFLADNKKVNLSKTITVYPGSY